MRTKVTASKYLAAFCILLLIPMINACSPGISSTFSENSLDYPKAEVVFEVHLAVPLPEGASLYFEVLDDVTGLYFNSSRHSMAAMDGLNYYIRIPLMVSSEIKYRYVKIQESAQYEVNSLNQQVRFRIARVDGPNIVHDEVCGWLDMPCENRNGEISGQAIDKSKNSPIPNLLVVAGGLQTITASDGSFLIEKIPSGLHNLVVYSMDGTYDTFQQEALVAEGAVTPVQVYLDQRNLTTVSFTVKLPDDHEYDQDLPLRFVSNLHSLGNAYADLAGGSTGNAANYPVMERIEDQVYRIKLTLPIGTHLRYKYSFGDGFWNSELNASGNFVTRDLLVTKNFDPKDQIETFLSPGIQPVSVSVEVPPETPANESVSLQLNPFGWMEPIPMIQDGNGQWKLTVYSPLHLLRSIEYRFCRNGDCTFGEQNGTKGVSFLAETNPIEVTEKVESWDGLVVSPAYSVLTSAAGLSPRPDFVTAVALRPTSPSILASKMDSAILSAKNLGAEWIVLSPTWTVSSTNPLTISPVPSQDLLWDQLALISKQTRAEAAQLILYPKLTYAQDGEKLIESNFADQAWREDWFSRYSRFILQNADLASTQLIPYLVIGEPSLSQIPGSEEYWAKIIGEIRSRYSGKIAGVAVIGSNGKIIPSWLNQVDIVYVLLAPDISNAEEATSENLLLKYEQIINTKVLPIYEDFEKPIFISLEVPSSKNALLGTTLEDFKVSNQPVTAEENLVDTQLQAMIYNAAVISSAKTPWISGFISSGYAPFLSVTDTSSSVYMKPASDALWFWFHFLLNK